MKNVIIGMLVILTLSTLIRGCWQKNLSNPITIKQVHRIDTCFCKYDIWGKSGEWVERTPGALFIIDSCTKYMEGDTIKLLSIKL